MPTISAGTYSEIVHEGTTIPLPSTVTVMNGDTLSLTYNLADGTVGEVKFGVDAPAAWPFGTILRLTGRAMLDVYDPATSARDRLMVIRDDGVINAVVVSAGEFPVGKVDRWARSDWEPDTPWEPVV